MSDETAAPNPRRERLLEALVDQVARHGYQATTVAQITATARVSRTTFYEHFSDKQDCFLVAYRELAEHLLASIDGALQQAPDTDGTSAVLGVLVDLAKNDPDTAAVLTHGAMAAGLLALSERNRLLASIEQATERARRTGSTGAPTPDLPARALVGAAVRELAVRLHRRKRPGDLKSELLAWAELYTHASAARPESDGEPVAPAATSKCRERSPGKRSRRTSPRNPRERIVRAAAELVRRNGYPQVTVAHIAAAANVNRETFYQHFADKESAYLASLQMAFEHTMAATAAAFFGQPDWAERVWNGAHGLVAFLAEESAIAHVAIVEPYAVGGAAVDLTIELQFAFTMFLEEGYRYRPGAEHTPRVTSCLIVAAALELLDRHLREQPEDTLYALVPDIAYLALAPFMGAEEASEFVRRKVAQERSRGETDRCLPVRSNETSRGAS
jgi:AcrR family transcriptional regulator